MTCSVPHSGAGPEDQTIFGLIKILIKFVCKLSVLLAVNTRHILYCKGVCDKI